MGKELMTIPEIPTESLEKYSARALLVLAAAVDQYLPVVQGVLAEAKELVVESDFDFERSTEAQLETKHILERIEAEEEKIVSPLKQKTKAVKVLVRKLKGPLAKAKILFEKKRAPYYEKKRKAQEEDNRRIREETERLAEADRRRFLKIAEKAEEKGDENKAERYRGLADAVPNFIPVEEKIEKSVTTGAGRLTMVDDIRVEIVDDRLALASIFNGELPISAIEWRLGEIKRFVKATKKEKIPGIAITHYSRSVETPK